MNDVPLDLQYFKTNIDGRYVFHWAFSFAFISPILSTLDWELQIDKITTFNSPALLTYNKTSAASFQNGNVAKGFEIQVADRLENKSQTFYARVRTVDGIITSDWSSFISFIIPPKMYETSAENLLESMPDSHVYNKDILTFASSDRNTKLYGLYFRMLSKQLDSLILQTLQTKEDTFVHNSRDEALFDNFGAYFGFQKPLIMTNVEYRRALESFILGSLEGGTLDSVYKIVIPFTGVPPTIKNIRDEFDFIIVANENDPNVTYLDPATPPFLIGASETAFSTLVTDEFSLSVSYFDSTNPTTFYNSGTAANGVEIQLTNPGAFTLNVPLISDLIHEILPANVEAFVYG